MEYSLKEAAEAAGVSKSTIHRKGFSKNERGKIDASELARIYPNIIKNGTGGTSRETVHETSHGTARHGRGTANGTAEINVLQVKFDAAQKLADERESELQHRDQTIEHLRSELEDEKQERRQAQTKLTALLTDQRPATSAVDPAPKHSPSYALWALVAVLFAGVIWWLVTQGA